MLIITDTGEVITVEESAATQSIPTKSTARSTTASDDKSDDKSRDTSIVNTTRIVLLVAIGIAGFSFLYYTIRFVYLLATQNPTNKQDIDNAIIGALLSVVLVLFCEYYLAN